MQRRDFLKMAGLAAASSRLVGQQEQSLLAPVGSEDVAKTDFTLQIAPVTVELAPNRIISTIGYNGTSPGPLLRMKEGVPVTVNAVSYTHLDVYKRQDQSGSEGGLVCQMAGPLTPGRPCRDPTTPYASTS